MKLLQPTDSYAKEKNLGPYINWIANECIFINFKLSYKVVNYCLMFSCFNQYFWLIDYYRFQNSVRSEGCYCSWMEDGAEWGWESDWSLNCLRKWVCTCHRKGCWDCGKEELWIKTWRCDILLCFQHRQSFYGSQ